MARQYSDSEIQEISDQLRNERSESWSHSPRIYIVLRDIGKLDYVRKFIDNGITDLWFPFSQESIPHGVPPAAYTKFQGIQKSVLTGTINLEDGGHCSLTKEDLDELNYPKTLQWKDDLGSGGFGNVYKVSGSRGKEYALKRIHRRHRFRETLEVMKYFESELAVLKKISNIRSQHFVELVGSYTTSAWVGLIMSPVADDNLANFLAKVPESANRRTLLWKFFGCLSSALSDLHFTLRIRHKDIKPQNILVQRNNILLTDFGMALDWSDMGQTTTKEELRRSSFYCAPEVARDELRRSSSDIWSLGCVYLEMITVLKRETIKELRQFFRSKGSKESSYWANQEAISLWAKRLQDSGDSEFENEPLKWIKMMLEGEEHRRPDARALRDLILKCCLGESSSITFSGDCCKSREGDSNSPDLDLGSNSPDALSQNEITLTLVSAAVPAVKKEDATLVLGSERMELHCAARSGEEAVVRRLLRHGADIEAKDSSKRTALHLATVNGHGAVTRLLLDEGAEINAKDNRGTTALICSIWGGQGPVVQQLLEKGADVDAKNDHGWAALHVAAMNGHDEIVRILLEKNAAVGVKDKDDQTPLHWAAQMGHVQAARILLENGADVSAKDRDDWTPLRRAAKRGHAAVVELLEPRVDVKAADQDGWTVLHEQSLST